MQPNLAPNISCKTYLYLLGASVFQNAHDDVRRVIYSTFVNVNQRNQPCHNRNPTIQLRDQLRIQGDRFSKRLEN